MPIEEHNLPLSCLALAFLVPGKEYLRLLNISHEQIPHQRSLIKAREAVSLDLACSPKSRDQLQDSFLFRNNTQMLEVSQRMVSPSFRSIRSIHQAPEIHSFRSLNISNLQRPGTPYLFLLEARCPSNATVKSGAVVRIPVCCLQTIPYSEPGDLLACLIPWDNFRGFHHFNLDDSNQYSPSAACFAKSSPTSASTESWSWKPFASSLGMRVGYRLDVPPSVRVVEPELQQARTFNPSIRSSAWQDTTRLGRYGVAQPSTSNALRRIY